MMWLNNAVPINLPRTNLFMRSKSTFSINFKQEKNSETLESSKKYKNIPAHHHLTETRLEEILHNFSINIIKISKKLFNISKGKVIDEDSLRRICRGNFNRVLYLSICRREVLYSNLFML
jgi:hypothetical protein